MRSILVQAGRDKGMAARLDTAMDLARAHEGHVTLAIDTPVDQYVTVDPYGGAYVAREALDAAIAADDALAAAPAEATYARVDLIRLDDGTLAQALRERKVSPG